MGNYARLGGCSTKMAGGGSREVVREQGEKTQRRSGMSHQLGEMYERVLKRGGWGVRQQGRNRKRWGAWNQQASACLALQKPLWFAVWIQAKFWRAVGKIWQGRSWWRELRHCVKDIGQDEARGRIAQWISQACPERDWRLLKGWVERSGGGGGVGEGVTALYSRLLLSCGVGLRVGGGGLSGGEGDYITVLQTYARWCKETPD